MMRFGCFLVIALGLSSCGGGSNSLSPVEECDDLLDLICTKIQSCGEQLSGTAAPPTFHKECLDKQRTLLDCSKATSVGASYERCNSELVDFSCSIFLTLDANETLLSVNLPASCTAVINGL